MPEFIRSIAGRLRGFVANRRSPPRLTIHLEASLALSVGLPGAKTSSSGEQQKLRLTGYTRDISETGLALVVPSIRIGGQYLVSEDRTLQITLELPDGAIEIYARPVRYTPLDQDAGETGYLVGVQITRISDADRARYLTHIQTLSKGMRAEG